MADEKTGGGLMGWLPSAGAAVLNAFTGAFNVGSQAKENQRQREWQEKMFYEQRTQALADRAFANQYNSPAAQMERLKAAGLNPNLVYGNGAVQQPSSPVRSSEAGSWSPKAPQLNLGNPIQDMYDIRMKQAQTDNLIAQKDVILQDAALKVVQQAELRSKTKNIDTNTAVQEINKELQSAVLGSNIELKNQEVRKNEIEMSSMRQQMDKTAADINFTNDQNVRAWMQSNAGLDKIAYEILKLQAETKLTGTMQQEALARIENMKKDGVLKDWEIGLNKLGINKNDSAISRGIQKMWSGMIGKAIDNQTKINKGEPDAKGWRSDYYNRK